MINYGILGIVQGLTEFLPVSSSGHLVIMQQLLRMRGLELELAVVVHLGTCLAVCIFFRKDLVKLLRDRRRIGLVLLVTAVTGAIGILGKGFFERLFTSIHATAGALCVTGGILIASKKHNNASRQKLTVQDAGVLGIVQGLAIIPGISRSGITISTLLFRGVSRRESFTFSFLASIPAVLGAAVLEFADMDCACTVSDNLGVFAVAFTASFISGLFALWLLRLMMQRAVFHYFGYYCLFVGVITFIMVSIGK